ncbi:hypothetical protein DP939_32880 [Spongiactinospora rosea]|uniref:Uncharacterized protein n=1 Tax=Spongiactinospora rosea TaxID=2248750 RepID=A0A366LPB8_9ACTN|nr:hypothetical protein [Spongiactinospora rosea]RBQ15815.1 hypothetical protein DP939_32880 [Spongiactinospora rosea]
MRARDPYAVALANASLLGAGYVMLGRRRLALITGAVTVALILSLALVARSAWFQGVVLLWWAALTVHGWWLAREHGRSDGAGRQRLIALGLLVPVLLAVGWLRLDAARIEQDAAAAHRAGRCSQAVPILRRLWFGHRVADAPLSARTDDNVAACQLMIKAERQAAGDRLAATETLRAYAAHPGALWPGVNVRRADLFLAQAAQELGTALTGDTAALETGFGRLSRVLAEFTGQEAKVQAVLDGFLGGLPLKDACATRTITDWLGEQAAGGGALDHVGDAVARVAPAAIVGCGDDLADDKDWKDARAQYRQLLDQYPGHPIAGRARQGEERATLEIELAEFRRLVKRPASGGKPAYCEDPAPYHGADPYRGSGPHRAMVFGNDGHRRKLPSSWLAKDPADAVLVICVGKSTFGSTVRSCYYEPIHRSGPLESVAFRKRKVSVRVYEVRTGKLVSKRSIQIGGASCPARIHYTFYGIDPGAPPEKYVKSSTADVRAAYASLIRP